MKRFIVTTLTLTTLASCGHQNSHLSESPACKAEASSTGITLSCPNSHDVFIPMPKDGEDGKDGESCTVTQLSNGALIKCGSESAVVYNGEDGEDGEDATSAIGIASYIKPCGQEFNNDEIFLRLTDGNILALYDGGPNLDRLVLLAPGNYITTDRNSSHTCHFTVTPELELTNQYVN